MTGIPPLHLQLNSIATSGRILRLNIPTASNDPIFYQRKSTTNQVKSYQPYLVYLNKENQNLNDLQIYTDGSKLNGKTGYAYCIFQEDIQISTRQVQINPENSVFQAELLAIADALKWIEESNINSAVLHTDSLSGLLALENIFTKNTLVIEIIQKLQELKANIKFNWVKSHIGITGNEQADKLA